MKYLQRYQIQELKEFCKRKIFNIISTIENKNKKECRGRYKGYIYGIKSSIYDILGFLAELKTEKY